MVFSRKVLFEPDLPVHLLDLDARDNPEAKKHKGAVINEVTGKFPTMRKAFARFEEVSKEVRAVLQKTHLVIMGHVDASKASEVVPLALDFAKDRVKYLRQGLDVMAEATSLMPVIYKTSIQMHVTEIISDLLDDMKSMIRDIEEVVDNE